MSGETTRPSYRPRLLLGVGRQQERRLVQAFGNDKTLRVVGRCNSATELLSRVGQEDAEVLCSMTICTFWTPTGFRT